MATRGASSEVGSREDWAAQVASFGGTPPAPREPLTRERIVRAALLAVAEEGFAALTMRRIAEALQVTPGALYVHVQDKAALDQLLIGEICASVELPEPDPASFREQALHVCRQLKDQYLAFPGVAQAAFAAAPHSLDSLRLYEGLLGILLAGGAEPEDAAWAIDAVLVYIGGFSLVTLRRSNVRDAEGRSVDREEFIARLRMLPAERFPNAVTHAGALTSGSAGERFDFTIRRMLDGLVGPRDHGRDH